MAFKTKCGKCSGTGRIRAFSHIQAGRCFSCSGAGYFETKTDPKVLAARRAKRAAKRKAAVDLDAARWIEISEARAVKYATDPRIGPSTLESCNMSDPYAFDVYRLLDKADTTGVLPHVLRNIAR